MAQPDDFPEIYNRNAEISRLKAENRALLAQMKSLSAQIDSKIGKHKSKPVGQPDPSATLIKMNNEIECLNKMRRNYEKELEQLKVRLQYKTGYDHVLEISDKIERVNEERGTLENKKKRLQKFIKDTGNVLQKNCLEQKEGTKKQEEQAILDMEQKLSYKRVLLEKEYSRQVQVVTARDKFISELANKVIKLENELRLIKENALKNVENTKIKPKENEDAIAPLRRKMASLQDAVEAENKKFVKEKEELTQKLKEFSYAYKELQRKNKVNGEKVLEYTRMTKFGKTKSIASIPMMMCNMRRKKVEFRISILKKYTKKIHVHKNMSRNLVLNHEKSEGSLANIELDTPEQSKTVEIISQSEIKLCPCCGLHNI